ncbi:glucan endo-1,3-beta-glucosidase 4-like isoform X2 [Salvia miltiorrhiza]|nr:glucan endo-1,3-beta-glucosidase 4-like isoform X2 [Salvia miltiorrhiza]XP_057765058.1 glucan endo-1,3-beta-glucosidase 4-like isoform X2 [Salvia miltiorrhiza]XP_057765059.1 glucan endo-1,3-beta-glucosidase 4-like isoform X2 [Salvia miltiorrhiza]
MLTRTLVALFFLLSLLHNSDGQFADYCIADEQTPEDEVVQAMKWACGNGADCSAIGENGVCYLPNTVKDHASYAFNSYYQNMKHKGGSCYFNAAAILSDLDPSHNSCKFEYLP